jgi:hypothetical protein
MILCDTFLQESHIFIYAYKNFNDGENVFKKILKKVFLYDRIFYRHK